MGKIIEEFDKKGNLTYKKYSKII
ncbi:hypothetical protein LCGC14_3072420, partial [marine sediment metagenome]